MKTLPDNTLSTGWLRLEETLLANATPGNDSNIGDVFTD